MHWTNFTFIFLAKYENSLIYPLRHVSESLSPNKQAYSKLSFQRVELNKQKLFLGGLSVGFGDSKATAENLAPAIKEAKPPEGLLGKAASTCCGRLADTCCGMCLLQSCTFVNDQCTIVCTQLCAALACFELIKCCVELCECDCLQ